MSPRDPHRLAASLWAAALALLLLAPSANALARDATVGAEGELFLIRAGSYGELFPEAGLADADNPVLALDVVQADQRRERLLVPGTETMDLEDSATILFENDSETLFVLWQARVNLIHSRLVLVGLRDGAWTEPIEISGNPFGWKSSPQLAVTRDSFRVPLRDGSVSTSTRTVVHLIWWEEETEGPAVLYTPVVFLDGRYTGWNPVYRVEDLGFDDGGSPPAARNLALAEAPKIEQGDSRRSVVLGFVDASTGELVSMSLEVLPGELGYIADDIRHQISDLGRDLLPDRPQALAGKIRHQISDLGARLGLHPGVAAYLADNAEAAILATPPGAPVNVLADKIRHQISDLGARIGDRGFDRVLTKSSELQVVELSSGLDAGAGAPPNLLRVVRASSRPAPETGEDVVLFLSSSGRDLLVSWIEDGAILYRESRGDDWSVPRQLRLGGSLDLGRAWEILDRRADELSGNAR